MEDAPLPTPAQGQIPAAPAPAADPMAAGGAAPAPGMGSMAGGDPMGGMPEDDPMAGDEAGMEGDDSTEGIIDQLSDDDKEAVRNYAKSLLNRDETSGEEDADIGSEIPAEDPNAAMPAPAAQSQAPAAPVQEGIMMQMSKARLNRAQKLINERFRDADFDDRESSIGRQKMVKKTNKRSPFSNPWN